MKKQQKYGLIIMALLCLCFSLISCDKEDKITPQPPKITWDSENSTYTVKVGKTVELAPIYENAEEAIFAWKIEGKIVSTESSFTYTGDQAKDIFVELNVITSAGTAYAEAKIQVVNLTAPNVSLSIPAGGYKIIQSGDLKLEPVVENADGTTYTWYVNDTKTAETKDYTFNSSTTGEYVLKMVATNEDGSDQITFNVLVCTADELPFSWYFEREEFNVSAGRSLRIKAFDPQNAFDAQYTWSVNGEQKQTGTDPVFILSTAVAEANTVRTVSVTMKNAYTEITKNIKVNICMPEGAYKRDATATSSEKFNKVYEFLPAPGQFINEGYTATTMDEAVVYATKQLQSGNAYVCLGGFGGYIVVGFDHSIENDGSYNIQIKGNSFAGSSEPGIVWVMQDENGDGLPNDTWYELKGSEYGKDTEIRDYACTYYRPKAPGMPVQWTDNQGKSGSVDYLGSYHRQDYYYPLWVSEDSYTLRGTCLPASNRETTPGYWYNGEFDWGYADNFSNVDRLTNDINYGAAANGNHFKISDAVTFDGNPANLRYIDFVKIQTGVNCKSGWLGEVSTEVLDIKDFNLFKNN